MIDPSLFVVRDANRNFIAVHACESPQSILASAPEWRALHCSQIGANEWLAYWPEGHVVLQLYRYPIAAIAKEAR